MEVFNKICALLDEYEVTYIHKEHEETLTSEESAKVRGDDLASGAKAILYKVQDQFYIFVLAADQRLDTKLIKQYFKHQGLKAKKTRFATADELKEMTGLVPGSVPPFGRPILDFPLYVDPSLLENKFIAFNAGSLTNSLSMSLDDYMKICDAKVFDFTKEATAS